MNFGQVKWQEKTIRNSWKRNVTYKVAMLSKVENVSAVSVGPMGFTSMALDKKIIEYATLKNGLKFVVCRTRWEKAGR